MLIRPPQYQVAALCYQRTGSDLRILLITSRETKRWILPKGWPMSGRDAGGAARQEAWEEAGVRPAETPSFLVGAYRYPKVTNGGVPVDTAVDVYAIEVAGLEEDFPEASERTRVWISPEDAADRVNEEGLATLLRGFRHRISHPDAAEMLSPTNGS
ncbi:NUDIX hydrolase [Primorskyibacter sp. 2E107]